MTHPAGQRSRGRRHVAALLAAVLVAGVQTPLHVAHASTGGLALTSPVTADLRPIWLDGTTSGQLNGRIDLPVPLGDLGEYRLEGIAAPAPDATGNGLVERTYPAGPVDGVLTDPEDGDVDDEPGRGIDIGESAERIVRTPSGLRVESTLRDVVVDVEGLNDKAAVVLGVTEVVRADEVATVATAGVDGHVARSTSITGLTLLGQPVPTPGGVLAGPVTRTHNRVITDPVPLLRALGIDEEDISEFESLIDSARLELTLRVTVRPSTTAGLEVIAAIAGTAEARVIFGLGSANLRTGADDTILTASFGQIALDAPSAIAPTVSDVSPGTAEPGAEVSVQGAGFVVGGTSVTVAGTDAEVVSVEADGSGLVFRLPDGLAGGEYSVALATVGGAVAAGTIVVDADDTIPLRVTGLSPVSGPDGTQVTVTGAGFVPDQTSAQVRDADGVTHRVGASRITVAESRVSATFPLPEGLALGAATVTLAVPGQTADPASFTVQPLQLPAVPTTGVAAVVGLSGTQTQVPLTADNSSPMTWTAPSLINPAGSAGALTTLQVGNPAVDTLGRGQVQQSVGGYTGTVTRELDSLTAELTTGSYGLQLPAPWDSFFSPAGAVVTADAITARAVARTDATTSTHVDLANLRVLGQPVALSEGRLTTAQEFSVAYNSDNLKSRQAMTGVFWSSAGGGYDRQKSETSATLWVRVEPVADVSSGGTATATAFRVVADLLYRYNGENGGILSTRARHGSGGDRNGQRVRFFEAVVGEVSATRPTAVTPVVTAATPNLVTPGTTVTLAGRGFGAGTTVRVGTQAVTPVSVLPDGTGLSFVMPAATSGYHEVKVENLGGLSNGRTLAVPGAPVITEQPPAEAVARVGQDVDLSVGVDGVPYPSVRWQHLVAGEWVDIPGADDLGYEFRASEADHGRRLRAVVTNSEGEIVSTETSVRIQISPSITTQPVAVEVDEGEQLALEVAVVGLPAPSVQWQRRDTTGEWHDVPGATGTRAELTASHELDGVTFRAVVENEVGRITSQGAVVTVRHAPIVEESPADVLVGDGAPVLFTAGAKANPAAGVRWEAQLAGESGWTELDGTDTDLTLTASAAWDRARVRAVFDNGRVPAAVSVAATIRVVPLPSITGVSDVGETLAVAGEPWSDDQVDLAYQWLRDGEPIDGATDTSYELVAADRGFPVSVRVTATAAGLADLELFSEASDLVLGYFDHTTAPTITGDLEVGGALTVDDGAWSVEGVELARQWYVDGEPVDGATAATYVLRPGDLDGTVSVVTSATALHHHPVTVESAAEGAVGLGRFENVVLPTVEGEARVGLVLAANEGAWQLEDLALSYRWLRDGEPVDGAMSADYELRPVDLGASIAVEVTAVSGGYHPATAVSEGTVPTVAGVIVSTLAPAVTGGAVVGEELSVSTGGWDLADVDLDHQWLLDGAPIEGATGETHRVRPADLGGLLSVAVTAGAEGYAPTTVTTAPAGPVVAGTLVNTAAPVVTGVPRVGESLELDGGAWSVADVELTVQWLRGATPIAGATEARYQLVPADRGATITARVGVTSPGYTPAVATAAGLGPVAEGVLETAGDPVVTGELRVGGLLVVTVGDRGGVDVGLDYQWLRDGVDIPGATGETYLVQLADLDSSLSVRVRAQAPGRAPQVVESPASSRVAQGELGVAQPPVLTGTAMVGRVLNASPGSWFESGLSLSWRWLVDDVLVAGVDGPAYQVRPADQGKSVWVEVTAVRAGYAAQTVRSAPSAAVARGELVAVVAPAVSGQARVGQVLRVGAGQWHAVGATVAYQWLRGGQEIAGARSAAYAPTAADQGRALGVRLTVSAPGYTPRTVALPVGTVGAGVLTASGGAKVVGKVRVGQSVSVGQPRWSTTPTSVRHEWLVGGVVVSRDARYTIRPRDLGKSLAVRVSASAPGYTTVTVSSGNVRVRKGTLEVKRKAKITGRAVAGQTLRVRAPKWSTTKVTVRYQWLRGSKVVGEGTKYRVRSADAGKRLKVRVVANSKGYQELRTTTAARTVGR